MKMPRIRKRIALLWAAVFIAAASAGAGIATSFAGNSSSAKRQSGARHLAVVPPVIQDGISGVRQNAANLEKIVTQALGDQSYIQSVNVVLQTDEGKYLPVDVPTRPKSNAKAVIWVIKAHGLVRGSRSSNIGSPPPDAEHDVYYTFSDATGENESFGLLDVPR